MMRTVPAEHLSTAHTVQGQSIAITADNGTVIQADIECDNGVIHVIDGVFLPS